MYRVVIADDEDIIRRGLTRQIEQMGLDARVVATAADGEETLRVVEEYDPEILLLDINMPFLDGLECLRRLRESGCECAVLILTGYDRFDYAQKAIPHEVSQYLLKPVEDEEFKTAMAEAIRKYDIRRDERDLLRKALPPCREGNVVAYLKKHFMDQEISVEGLEEQFNMSRTALLKAVKTATGMGCIEYITALRIEYASRLLTGRRAYTVREIAEMAGYPDQHYFSRVFKNCRGLSPREYREKNLLQ